MTSTIIPLWSARDFSFSALAANKTRSITFPPTRILPFREVILLVRVHHVDITGSADLDVEVRLVAPSCDEPSRSFVNPSILLAVHVADASSGTLLRVAAPLVLVGADVQASVVARQPSTPQTIKARLSAAFFGRHHRASLPSEPGPS